MFVEISKSKLKMIFDVVKDEEDKVAKKELFSILETFYDQLVEHFNRKLLTSAELTVITENYKCVL